MNMLLKKNYLSNGVIILSPFQNVSRLMFLHTLKNTLIKRKRNVILSIIIINYWFVFH